MFCRKGPRAEHVRFIQRAGNPGYPQSYGFYSRTDTITSFRKRSESVPWDLLR